MNKEMAKLMELKEILIIVAQGNLIIIQIILALIMRLEGLGIKIKAQVVQVVQVGA